jgi:prepilin-type N-terminal cleavage/methylation domain-containing protein
MKRHAAFTLIEVAIVIIVIAMLAAAVWPQLTSGPSGMSEITAAEFELGQLRSTLESYRSEHGGQSPSIDKASKTLVQLLRATHADGSIAGDGEYGPYFEAMPENPLTGACQVRQLLQPMASASDVTPGNRGGWLYHPGTGQIWLDCDPGFEL